MKLDVCIEYVKHALCGLPDYKLGCDMHKLLRDNSHIFEDHLREKFGIDMNAMLEE